MIDGGKMNGMPNGNQRLQLLLQNTVLAVSCKEYPNIQTLYFASKDDAMAALELLCNQHQKPPEEFQPFIQPINTKTKTINNDAIVAASPHISIYDTVPYYAFSITKAQKNENGLVSLTPEFSLVDKQVKAKRIHSITVNASQDIGDNPDIVRFLEAHHKSQELGPRK